MDFFRFRNDLFCRNHDSEINHFKTAATHDHGHDILPDIMYVAFYGRYHHFRAY